MTTSKKSNYSQQDKEISLGKSKKSVVKMLPADISKSKDKLKNFYFNLALAEVIFVFLFVSNEMWKHWEGLI